MLMHRFMTGFFAPVLMAAVVGGTWPTIAVAASARGMVALADEEMAAVGGQGLFLSDKIVGTNLLGGSNLHAAYHNPFTYYRMGLDAKLSMNINIAKLQLGCGGVNDALNRFACDLDMDYVRFMGTNGSTSPAGYGAYAGTAGGDSAFQMVRPYLELAVKNDGNPATREVVGIKFGAESVTGALSIGRNYPTGATNLENGYAGSTTGSAAPGPGPITNTCNNAAQFGNATLACDSGINSASGFLGVEISAKLGIVGDVCLTALCLLPIALDATGCVGRLTIPTTGCGGDNSSGGEPTYLDANGSRFTSLTLGSIPLRAAGEGVVQLLNTIGIDNIYATLYMDLRLLHHVTFNNSPDFFISFQRERVAYPSYGKQPLTASVPAGNPEFDACGASARYPAGSIPARCGSSYGLPANTGWWLNAPVVKFMDIQASLNLGEVPFSNLLNAFGPPGIRIDNPKFGLIAARNCYGAAHFC